MWAIVNVCANVHVCVCFRLCPLLWEKLMSRIPFYVNHVLFSTIWKNMLAIVICVICLIYNSWRGYATTLTVAVHVTSCIHMSTVPAANVFISLSSTLAMDLTHSVVPNYAFPLPYHLIHRPYCWFISKVYRTSPSYCPFHHHITLPHMMTISTTWPLPLVPQTAICDITYYHTTFNTLIEVSEIIRIRLLQTNLFCHKIILIC